MIERLRFLEYLINKYSIEEINTIYRNKEVALEIESFNKDPDVNWSEPLKQKMIQQAKRKKISDGRKKYLAQLIENVNNYDTSDLQQRATADLILLFENLNKLNIQLENINIILIEFDDNFEDARVYIYGGTSEQRHKYKLGMFTSKFSSTSYWKEFQTNKFSDLSELLEIIEIEEEEYPAIIPQIWELRVFNCMSLALKLPIISDNFSAMHKNIQIKVGRHDERSYIIKQSIISC